MKCYEQQHNGLLFRHVTGQCSISWFCGAAGCFSEILCSGDRGDRREERREEPRAVREPPKEDSRASEFFFDEGGLVKHTSLKCYAFLHGPIELQRFIGQLIRMKYCNIFCSSKVAY